MDKIEHWTKIGQKLKIGDLKKWTKIGQKSDKIENSTKIGKFDKIDKWWRKEKNIDLLKRERCSRWKIAKILKALIFVVRFISSSICYWMFTFFVKSNPVKFFCRQNLWNWTMADSSKSSKRFEYYDCFIESYLSFYLAIRKTRKELKIKVPEEPAGVMATKGLTVAVLQLQEMIKEIVVEVVEQSMLTIWT